MPNQRLGELQDAGCKRPQASEETEVAWLRARRKATAAASKAAPTTPGSEKEQESRWTEHHQREQEFQERQPKNKIEASGTACCCRRRSKLVKLQLKATVRRSRKINQLIRKSSHRERQPFLQYTFKVIL